nr:reverse transcriptase domain-containing protein [Tanacetum cinerariifolium]
MSTRLSARNLFPPLDNLELTIQRRSHANPTLLNDFEMTTKGNDDLPVPDLRTMKELCQPSLKGQGGPIAPIAIQATNFGLKNDMIQLSIKVNGVTDDALHLYLFPHTLTHHSTAWFDHFLRNSINTFEQMAKIFLKNYFPPSMVTKLRNEITNFCQRPDELLFEAWNQGNNHHQGNNQGRNQFFQRASHGQNPPPAYQALAYQTPGYQASVHQPSIPQSQVVTTTEFTNYMKANDSILKNMQTNMTLLTNSNLELKNKFGHFMKMNIASSSSSGNLPGNTITNLKEDLKGITTQSGTAYQGPMIPTTSFSLPKVVERSGTLPGNTISNPKEDLKGITTRSGVAYQGPIIPTPSKVVKQGTEANELIEKFYEIFKDMSFEISFTDALILMPKFAISSDSSHHSGANITKAEVDSIVRSSASAITIVTTVITTIDVDATAARVPVAPSLFGVSLSSTDEFAHPKCFASVRGIDHDQLFTEFNVGAARHISLNAEVRMRDEYNSKEKRKFRAVVDDQVELLKVKDGEIESLKAQLLLKEAEAVEAIQRCLREREKNKLSVKVTNLSASVKVREQEVADLDAQLEKFQDKKMKEVNEKFDKLCVDFVDMALHLEEKFYSHLLTTISGRRWLLTYGMELAIVKCLNSIEYLSALGAAISKAVEKGMQEGLSTGIIHGAEGRKLADVATYNPSVEADYLSALQRLQNVNFSLIAELKSNEDASVDTIMSLLRLDDALGERLGLTESQPHANQLMVHIHYSPDQCVVGASALSFSLDVSHSWVKKMRENIARHVSALRGMFVPLFEPLFAAALQINIILSMEYYH